MPKVVVQDEEGTVLLDLRPGETLRFGRSRDCDVPIDAPRASRHHAEIFPEDGGHAVRDLGSTNGTLLNGAPVSVVMTVTVSFRLAR